MSKRINKTWYGLALLLLLAAVIMTSTRTRYFREGMTVTDVRVSYYDSRDQLREVEIQPADANSIWITTPLATGYKRDLKTLFFMEVSSEMIHISLDGEDAEGRHLTRDLTYYSSGLVVIVSSGDSNFPADFYRLVDPDYGYDYYRKLLNGVAE